MKLGSQLGDPAGHQRPQLDDAAGDDGAELDDRGPDVDIPRLDRGDRERPFLGGARASPRGGSRAGRESPCSRPRARSAGRTNLASLFMAGCRLPIVPAQSADTAHPSMDRGGRDPGAVSVPPRWRAYSRRQSPLYPIPAAPGAPPREYLKLGYSCSCYCNLIEFEDPWASKPEPWLGCAGAWWNV